MTADEYSDPILIVQDGMGPDLREKLFGYNWKDDFLWWLCRRDFRRRAHFGQLWEKASYVRNFPYFLFRCFLGGQKNMCEIFCSEIILFRVSLSYICINTSIQTDVIELLETEIVEIHLH